MPQIKIVTNVADFGLFRPLATSRRRLILSAAVITALTGALCIGAAHFILDQSDSVGLNLLLITLIMLAVLVCAYLQSLVAGDLFFPGPWREQVILGQKATSDAEITTAASNRSAEFLILLFALVVANALLFDTAAGGFLDRYHNEGFFQVRLRSQDAPERLAALEDLSLPLNLHVTKRQPVRQAVLNLQDDPNPEVRARALWTIGSLDIEQGRGTLLKIMRDPKLEPPIRQQAATALGKLSFHDPPTAEALTALATDNKSPKAARLGALRALALRKPASAQGPLLAMTSSEDPELRAHVYWALREMGGKKVRAHILEARDQDLQGDRRCVVFDAYKFVAQEEDINWVRRHYRREKKDERCEPLIWEDYDEVKRYVRYPDSFRVKLIKVLANAGGASSHRAFFDRIIRDKAEVWRTREVAAEVLRVHDLAAKR